MEAGAERFLQSSIRPAHELAAPASHSQQAALILAVCAFRGLTMAETAQP
jgi:hypothetical protein